MGLLDAFTNMNPEQTQGLLAAAAQILQQSGDTRRPFGLGAAAGAGIEAYQGSQEAARQRKLQEQQAAQMARMRDLQMQQAQRDMGRQQRQDDQDTALQDAAKQSTRAGQFSFPSNPMAPVESGNQFDINGYIDKVMGIDPMKAMQLKAQFAPKAKKLKETTTELVDGKPVRVNWFEDGSHEVVSGVAPRKDLRIWSGGGKDVVYDSDELQAGQTFAKTMTPAEASAEKDRRERLNFDRSQVGKPVFSAELGGFALPPSAKNPSGTFMPLSGITKGPKMTEDQGKATGWLVQAENAFKNMRAVGLDKKGNPTSATRPGFNDALEAIPSFGLSGSIANAMRGADRQKFMQASASLGEALLRAATGAGVNRDEAAQKVRELTPQFGEDESVTQQKFDAIPLYIESLKVRAGPGAGMAAGVLAPKSGGWSIEKVGD